MLATAGRRFPVEVAGVGRGYRRSMPTLPPIVVFDVNETLSDLSGMQQRFTAVGAPPGLAATWFAGVLRDGFALTAVGQNPPFAHVAEQVLRAALADQPLTRPLPEAVAHVLSGFGGLPLHPDVAPGVRALRGAGHRLITLTNGAAQVSEQLLTQAGLRSEFELLLSVADAGAWKPAAAAYDYAVRATGATAGDLLLVAVHPWDIDGAARAGLHTAWVNRSGGPYPQMFRPPERQVRRIDELAG